MLVLVYIIIINIVTVISNEDQPTNIDDSFLDSFDDEIYYDGDQYSSRQFQYFSSKNCSIQCSPHWIEPILQQQQTLVYPTSASVPLKCSYQAKPKAKITWYKDGHIFSPELTELVKRQKKKKQTFIFYDLNFYISFLWMICI